MDCDRFKLFVGGIPRETSEESLKQHFSKYGAVLGALVAKERATGQPRGFGFVRFANASDVDKALADSHFILGRAVDVKKAIPKHEHVRLQQQNMQPYVKEVQQNNGGGGVHDRTKKLFVGGLSSETTEEEFKTYFEKFGKTTDVVVMHDSATNRPRGFGFVTYDSENSVEIVMQSHFHELSNKRVEVKRAIPKEGIQSFNGGNNQHNLPPTYSSLKATPYVPESNGYGMVLQYPPPPPVFGYHQALPGFQYPYGYPVTTQGPNVPWNNQIMPPANGFYCQPPPPTNTPCYLPYMNGFDPAGMSVTVFNAMPWPVAGDGVGVIIPRLEDLKLGDIMVKPLPNGAYR
ncbi:RNA-binding protein 1 [Hirschfeldia incana]|nr:RNA-binding protein 1 [Hirschfeldia incana]KAJ0231524.1 RNA-binding protein 1 [Hirschfeldia incana]